MKRIIDFCKKKYKTLIPLMVVLVLLLTVFFLYKEYKYDNYRDKKEVAVYQYFGGVKVEYKALITRNLKKAIVDVTAIDKSIEYDATPIYYQKEDVILFPKEMNIVFPLRDGSQYRLYKYASYTSDDNTNYITNGSDTGKYDYFFLYDGKGLFFIPEEMSLEIAGKEYIKLSKNSFVSIDGGYTLIYYDKETDVSEVIDVENKRVKLTSDDVEIDVKEKSFTVFNKKILLFSPDKLNAVFKTD